MAEEVRGYVPSSDFSRQGSIHGDDFTNFNKMKKKNFWYTSSMILGSELDILYFQITVKNLDDKSVCGTSLKNAFTV